MPDILAYRTALQRQVAQYAAAMQPREAPLPAVRHEVNARSDRNPKAGIGVTIPGLMKHTRCQFDFDLHSHSGKNIPIAIPERGIIHADVARRTVAKAKLRLGHSGKPAATVRFTRPIYVRDPAPTWYGLGKVLNSVVGFYLDKVIWNEDDSMWIEGRVVSCGNILHKRIRQQVRKPTSGDKAEQHSLVGIWLASSVRLLNYVPSKAGKALSRHLHTSLQLNAQESYFRLVDSLHHLLKDGEFRGDGVFDADKPVVIRTDLADVRFGAQSFPYNLRGRIASNRRGVSFTLDRGSEMNARMASFGLSGSMFFDGRSIQGRGIEMAMRKLQFDALLNNGTASAMLLPLSIDTVAAAGAEPVASVRGDFTFGDLFDKEPGATLGGSVRFALPVHVEDTGRVLQDRQGSLSLQGFRLQALLHGEVRQVAALPQKLQWRLDEPRYLCAPERRGTSRVRLGVDVDKFDAIGRLITSETAAQQWGGRANAPLQIFTSQSGQPPLTIRMEYHDVGQTADAATFGATIGFYLPMRIMPPASLSVTIPQGQARFHSAQLTSQGELKLGAHAEKAQYPNRDLAGTARFHLDEVDGEINANKQKIGDLDVREDGAITIRGRRDKAQRNPVMLRPPTASIKIESQRDKDDLLEISGTGAFSLPAQLPAQAKLYLGIPNGSIDLAHSRAQLRCNDLSFYYKDGPPQVKATIGVDAASGLTMQYTYDVQLPQPERDSDGETYFSAEEDPAWLADLKTVL